MKIKKAAVIGSGLMGRGIAQTIAQAGIDCVNIDILPEQIKTAEENVKANLKKLLSKDKINAERMNEILSFLRFSTHYEEISEADIIVEAVPEKMELKKQVFSQIDKLAGKNAVLVSNTSGLSISEIASVTERPDRVIAIHFFYPAPIMKLTEIIKGIQTSQATYDTARDFCETIGKVPVDAPELPGFLVNRILVPMMNEGAFCVMEGSKPEDVDKAMKLGANLPMGPLELADFVGLDVMMATMEGLYEGFKDSKYRPCPLIRTLVKAGHTGRKSGRGFYDYTVQKPNM
ncbi:MAG: 3-hydroxyacyl-CoA dehydrogenase NAD-binding domain-containing protein [Bacillota bacterium]|nr:3-hydroxyacyl-CoA dehydrogenase NAD-binding domain-containing protein [Bacillota bacterium]